ncbi:MAG: alpha/beta hydrolase [Verrucomicrobiales bacterium]|nr:alpha/beta hydrolase [Verrucomicrobiales bacterium]
MNDRPAIVLIHGLWVTPSSWRNFKSRFEELGYQVIASPWPGINQDVEAMRRNPSGLYGIGIEEVLAHYSKIILRLPEPPIIMGHSYGGLITQLLLDKGLGAAGVAIDSVPPKGIIVLPLSTYLALTPALLQPGTFRRTFLFSFTQWWRVFANTLSERDARQEYEREVIPASGRSIFQAALSNVTPNSHATIDFTNSARAPLLLVGGEKDVIMPAALNRKNFSKYRSSSAVVEYREFSNRSHYIIAEKGWEEVADYSLNWAVAHAKQPSTPASSTVQL